MNNRKSYMLLLCILILFGLIPVSSQQISFKHYSVKEGVSQSEIKCIYQDSEGYIWFGTQNGLNKFNGYTFEKFFYNPNDPSSISNSWIYGITEDTRGNIWVGTKGGLNRFDKKTGHFALINHRIPGSVINDNFVYGITSDDSLVYINTPPALSVLNFNTGKLDTYNNQFAYEGILYDIGYPIIHDKDGLIWIASTHGLSCFDPRSKQFKNFVHDIHDAHSLSDNQITALCEDRSGNILVGTSNGLNLYDKNSNLFFHWFHDEDLDNSLSSNFIRSIILDHTGAIWVGTEEGGLNKMIYSKQGNPAHFSHFRSLADNANYISHDIVYSLYEDKSHNLWIGTIAGVDKMDLKRKKFRHYKKTDDPASVDLLDNVIASIYRDDDGKLWIGNWNKGLNILDRKTNKVKHFSSSNIGKMHIPENNVHVIFRDSNSRIWLGTRNGVFIFMRKSEQFIPFQQYFNIEDSGYFNGNRVYCIIEDSAGNIWIGTGNGIFILDTKTNETRIIRAGNSTPHAISNNLVYSLLEDRDKNIWIATSNGLDQYVPPDGVICHYLRQPGSKSTLCDNYTISLCEDFSGNIWVGTSTGVNRFNRADSVFYCYTMNEGLPSNIIYDIVEDNNHDLWFTTGNGLARYNPSTQIIKPFTLEEGVQGMEFNIKAVFKGEDGELFFGGMDGFISFFPDSLQDNDFIPPVKITAFEKENNGIRSNVSVYEDEIRLTFRDYSFTIEFAALDYSDPLKNQYAYQLEPLSEKWINIGDMRFVHFTNLPPGKYVFRVKGTNSDGFWNNAPTSIGITIAPPWWKSKYALLAYALLTLAAIFLYIRWREKSLIREKRALEMKVSERTEKIVRQKDELDELNSTKDKFFSILAHDLKGPFSSLYSMSEVLSQDYDNLEEQDKRTGLGKIHQLVELIYKLLENLLTWSRSQRGGMVFSPVRFNLSRLVEVNVNLHKVTAGEKGIILRNTVDKDHFAFGDLEMINTVIRNLVNNAVKYTSGGGTVEIEIKEQPKMFEVLVKDQGVGISSENMKKLFRIDVKFKTNGTAGETGTGLGLLLCREFVEKNGGKIWCDREENRETTFHFTIPRS
jgi:ligand-binding sensor domain-containing protein/signal transduction histidine kinase